MSMSDKKKTAVEIEEILMDEAIRTKYCDGRVIYCNNFDEIYKKAIENNIKENGNKESN